MLSLGVGAGLGIGQLALLRRGAIWRYDAPYENVTAELIWCGASAVVLAALAGSWLLGGQPDRVGRIVVAGSAGLGAAAAMVVAVTTAPRQPMVDPIPDYPLTPALYGWTAALGVAFGVGLVAVLLGRRALHGSLLVWQAWILAVLVLSLGAWQPDRPIDSGRVLLALLASALILPGVLAALLARSGQPSGVATAGGLSGLLAVALVEVPNLVYWYAWYERVKQCRVASGECYSFGLTVEIMAIVMVATVATAIAFAGAGIGHWLHGRTQPTFS